MHAHEIACTVYIFVTAYTILILMITHKVLQTQAKRNAADSIIERLQQQKRAKEATQHEARAMRGHDKRTASAKSRKQCSSERYFDDLVLFIISSQM